MAENIGTAYVQIVPTAKGISGKIEQELGGVGKSAGQSFSTGFGSVLGGIGKVAVAAVGAAATAVGGIVASAVSQYADFEQLAGGVETLFGDSAEYVINRAGAAFETAGLSANDYMETVTSFSASLLQSLGGDTEKAAKVADQAIVDMSDNANKMGSSMESIQNAYQGFAKQNYTMLDNLKLGYGGTKEEMQRLLKDAEKISGQKFDLSSYADVIQAIHVMQENMGIAGTTSKEAATTISGSLAMVKGAWDNVLSSIGQGNMDKLNENINDLVYSAETFAGNIMPVVQTALSGVSELISALAPEIAAALPEMIAQVLPGLLSAGVQVIDALAQGILQAIPQLTPMAVQVINSLIQTLLQLLPQLLSVGVDIILQLAQGITEALPTLIPAITDAVLQIVTMFTDPNTLTSLIQAGIDLMLALLDGLMQSLPQITAALPTIVQNICDALTANLPLIIDAATQLNQMLVENLPTITQALIDSAPQIIESLMNAVIECGPQLLAAGPILTAQLVLGIVQCLPQFLELGRQVVDSIIQGLANAYVKLTSEGPKMIQQLKDKISAEIPKLVQQGRDIVKKIIDGIKQWADNLYKQAQDLIEKVKTTIKGKIEGFGEVGKNIVNGIKEGLTSAWGELEKWFTEKINALKNKVKDVLKIESPSKVFADEIGRMIPLGIAQGIEDGMNALDTSVLDMTAGIVGTADQAMSAATYQSVPSASGDVYGLLANYLPLIANKEVNIKLEGGMDRFFRAIQAESRRNYQLTGATI